MTFEEKLNCPAERVEGLMNICEKCDTNHHITFEGVKKFMISKQKVREAIKSLWGHYGELARTFEEKGLDDRRMDALDVKLKMVELRRELGLEDTK